MSLIVRIGKKNAIYLPKKITETLNLREGDLLLVEIEENRIVMKPLPRLLKKRRIWSTTTIKELEEESEKMFI